MTDVDQVVCTSPTSAGQPSPLVSLAWNAGLPDTTTQVDGISAEVVAGLIKDPSKVAGRDFVIVDLRKDDFKDYAIQGAINLPANSFYQTRSGVVSTLSHIPLVIFHCQACAAPKTRGQKCAAYYQDALNEANISSSKAYYLEGGIKGWAEKYNNDDALIVRL